MEIVTLPIEEARWLRKTKHSEYYERFLTLKEDECIIFTDDHSSRLIYKSIERRCREGGESFKPYSRALAGNKLAVWKVER